MKSVMEMIWMSIMQVQQWDLEEILEEIFCSFIRVVIATGHRDLALGLYLVWDNKHALNLMLHKYLDSI